MGEDLFNILSEDEVDNLFDTEETAKEEETQAVADVEENDKENTEEDSKENTENIDTSKLFSLSSESVGEEELQELMDTSDETEEQTNFYSSIASALVEDGVLPIPDVDISEVKDASDFAQLLEESLLQRMTDKQRRVEEALNYGLEPTEIQKNERVLDYLGSITDKDLRAETTEGEELRKNLIMQDLLNRGYSELKALREVDKSLQTGSDIEDAIDAYNNSLSYYNYQYRTAVEESKRRLQEQEQEEKLFAEHLHEAVMTDDFEGIDLTRQQRSKISQTVLQPVDIDDDGKYLTALDKYRNEHYADYVKNVGLFFTLTNGFKDYSKLFKTNVTKQMKSSISNLEKQLKGYQTSVGSLSYANDSSKGKSSKNNNFFDIDI